MVTSEKWDRRFLGMAQYIATWSKDPSTQCGSVITQGKRIVSLGFNGLPSGVEDHPERLHSREVKYEMILHAEVNALMFAGRDLQDCTIYVWPMPPCPRCMAQIVQSGIKRVVSVPLSHDHSERWGKGLEVSKTMCKDAGVVMDLLVYFAIDCKDTTVWGT